MTGGRTLVSSRHQSLGEPSRPYVRISERDFVFSDPSSALRVCVTVMLLVNVSVALVLFPLPSSLSVGVAWLAV